MKIGLDTNVLVYSVDLADPPRQQRAIDLVDRVVRAQGAVAEQSLFEFLHVVVRKFGFPRDGAFRVVKVWRGLLETVLPNEAIFDDTSLLMQKYNLNVWDSRLLATCATAGVSILFSEDMQDGGQYGSVLVIDPFEAANDGRVDALLPP